jgi:hypothetical protein
LQQSQHDIRVRQESITHSAERGTTLLSMVISELRHISKNAAETDALALEALAAGGYESPEQKAQRIRVEAMAKTDLRQYMSQAFPMLSQRGPTSQLKKRVVAALRGDVLARDDTESENEEKERKDLAMQTQSKRQVADDLKNEAMAARREAKNFEKMMGVSKDAGSSVQLSAEEVNHIYANLQLPVCTKDKVRPGLYAATYGDIDGTIGEELQGQTPGMVRAIRVLQVGLPKAQHLILANRVEARGAVIAEKDRVRTYNVDGLKNMFLLSEEQLRTVVKEAANLITAKRKLRGQLLVEGQDKTQKEAEEAKKKAEEAAKLAEEANKHAKETAMKAEQAAKLAEEEAAKLAEEATLAKLAEEAMLAKLAEDSELISQKDTETETTDTGGVTPRTESEAEMAAPKKRARK